MGNLILDKSHCTIRNSRTGTTRVPYPFQAKAFSAMDDLRRLNPEGFSSMLVLPTGAGKTFASVHWILRNYIDCGVKVLWIAHRSELLRQAAEAFADNATFETLPNRTMFTSYVISSEFGRSCNICDNNPDVVIASRQSLCNDINLSYTLQWAKGKGLKKDRKLLLVLDEAHHAAAASYRKIIDSLKRYIPHVDILGLTATPYRTAQSEQGSLKRIFTTGSGIVYSIDMSTLIAAGILANPKHIEVSTNVDMTEVFDADELGKIAKTDLTSLDEKSLEKLNSNTNRNRLIVDTYLAHRKEYGQTIVFAIDVMNAIALNAIFQATGVKSDFVVSTLVSESGRAMTERNTQVIRDFRDGKLEVLVNVNIVTEGTDIPNIQTVFLARPTTSKILMTQMIGRGLRGEAAGGTKEANLVYFIDNWKGLVDFVSPKELLDGNDILPKQSSVRKAALRRYIHMAEVEEYAVMAYEQKPATYLHFNNIIPYGIIPCSYMISDDWDEEIEISKDIVVFDEASDIYLMILSDIPSYFPNAADAYTDLDIEHISSDLFFKYSEKGSGEFLGISSDMIKDIVLTYLATQETPKLQIFSDRVSLNDIVNDNYREGMTEDDINSVIRNVWKSNAKVRMWFDEDFYFGMMRVYFNRRTPSNRNTETVLLPKEKMDMGELKKHYNSYYQELRKYLIANMKQDDEGYYYSAIQEEGKPPVRSKHLGMFEMDHIIPISRGGLTVKENLQMITRLQNRIKGQKISDK